MRNLARIGLAALIAAAPAVAWAGAAHSAGRPQIRSLAAETFEQRKDVDEVSRPQPPHGPATPIPFCSPGSPICP
jgi:hypothetical protein